MTLLLARRHRLVLATQFIAVIVLALLSGGCGETTPREETGPDSAAVEAPTPSMSVSRVLQTDRRFSTLVATLDSTGLDSTLAGAGPYTLFAPPDSAFDALPDGTVPLLLSEQRGRLQTILAHHVVDGRFDPTALADSSNLTTLQGDTLRIRTTDSTLTVGNADVLDGVSVANGVIHVVDEVLRPPESE